MDTWNSLTAVRGEWGLGPGRKKVKGLSKTKQRNIYMHDTLTQTQCGDSQRERGGRGGGRGQREGNGDGKRPLGVEGTRRSVQRMFC